MPFDSFRGSSVACPLTVQFSTYTQTCLWFIFGPIMGCRSDGAKPQPSLKMNLPVWYSEIPARVCWEHSLPSSLAVLAG